jgi:hypothetical protein
MVYLPCCFCREVEIITGPSQPVKSISPWLKTGLESLSISNAIAIAEWTKTDTRGLLGAASILQLGERDTTVPWFSIIAIWINGPRSLVELLWLEKDDRETRTLIMLLVLSDTEDDALGSYLTKCERYEPVEQELRKEEINAVAAFRREHADKVIALIDKVRVIRNSWLQQAPSALRATNEVHGVAMPVEQ